MLDNDPALAGVASNGAHAQLLGIGIQDDCAPCGVCT